MPRILRVSQGFGGTREHWQNIKGNKGTLTNFWEQGTKFRNITVRKHSERVWEHGNIGQFWKGTREQGPPWETLNIREFHEGTFSYAGKLTLMSNRPLRRIPNKIILFNMQVWVVLDVILTPLFHANVFCSQHELNVLCFNYLTICIYSAHLYTNTQCYFIAFLRVL